MLEGNPGLLLELVRRVLTAAERATNLHFVLPSLRGGKTFVFLPRHLSFRHKKRLN